MPRYENIEELAPDLNGDRLSIAIVVSRFNNDISDGLLSSCTATLMQHGVTPNNMLIVSVPGALEAPLTLQKLAQSGRYDALVALGAVIRGETYHFEIVSNEAANGITSVQLETGVPIANGILTTENDDQALARMMEKGADCARAAIEMANLLQNLDERRV